MSNLTVYQPQLDPIDREIHTIEQQLANAKALLPFALKMAAIKVQEAEGMAAAAVRSANAAAHRKELENVEYQIRLQQMAASKDNAAVHHQVAALQKACSDLQAALSKEKAEAAQDRASLRRMVDAQGAKASKLDSLLRDDTL